MAVWRRPRHPYKFRFFHSFSSHFKPGPPSQISLFSLFFNFKCGRTFALFRCFHSIRVVHNAGSIFVIFKMHHCLFVVLWKTFSNLCKHCFAFRTCQLQCPWWSFIMVFSCSQASSSTSIQRSLRNKKIDLEEENLRTGSRGSSSVSRGVPRFGVKAYKLAVPRRHCQLTSFFAFL